MANPEHLKILKQGVEAWNAWREENTPELIDFRGANLSHADFSGANFDGADFSDASLVSSNLGSSNLRSADLIMAKLSYANLRCTNLNCARLLSADLSRADLSHADLSGASLLSADLSGAVLSHADLTGATLRETNLRNADLYDTDLHYADLGGVILIGAILTKTNLRKASIGWTILGNLDLRKVIGLDAVIHNAPSTIGIDTLYKSHGEIPDKFLLDAGMPEDIIDIARSLRAGPAIQWHSCFISFSTKDDGFARQLHSRMREANMRVWFAPEDLKGGKKLHEQLFEAIQMNDRLLIVLSEHSIQSEWVMTEIRKAREMEKKEKRRKLFPILLTDFETLRDWTCFDADTGKDLAVEVREYAMPNDFSNWKNHDAFESAFARLKKDLEAENSKKT